MRIGIACGGTGGHLFPGLVTARALRARGHEVVLWLAGREAEDRPVSGWDGEVIRVRTGGFPAGFSPRHLLSAYRLARAVPLCRRLMRKQRPDVVLGMGSYACVAPALAASALRIPLVLHEANAVPGRAVSLLARRAAVVALAFESAARLLPRARTQVTGFPMRDDLGGRFADGLLDPDLFTLLVTGGSQGAAFLNETVSDAVCELSRRGRPLQVVHLTGTKDKERVETTYENHDVRHLVFSFLNAMGSAYAAADLAISRAGAATIAELAANRVPALLIPLPLAPRKHQSANAGALVEAGGADMMEQDDVTAAHVVEYVDTHMSDPDRRARMKEALAGISIEDGADRLAELVCRAGTGEPAR